MFKLHDDARPEPRWRVEPRLDNYAWDVTCDGVVTDHFASAVMAQEYVNYKNSREAQ